jgi:hypothetical protein
MVHTTFLFRDGQLHHSTAALAHEYQRPDLATISGDLEPLESEVKYKINLQQKL